MKEILAYRDRVAAELQTAIRLQSREADQIIGWGTDFFDRLESFAVGGKLLRGCLACYSYRVFANREPDNGVLKAAASLELAHSCLLIHDDVMDRDDIRRGQPSIHRQYALLGSQRRIADSERFGDSLAICGGDAALLLAFRLLSEARASGLSAGTGLLFADQLLQVCAGQMQDVYFDAGMELPAKSAILRMMRAKTAAYTIALPLAMGASLAGQKPATLRRLRLFGEAAGTIYQIRDDELGLSSKQSVVGKSVGSDIRQHKKTLIYYYLLKRTRGPDRQRLEAVFAKPEITRADLAFIIELFRRYRIGDDLAKDISRLKQQAVRSLGQLELTDSAQLGFLELLEFCATRSS